MNWRQLAAKGTGIAGLVCCAAVIGAAAAIVVPTANPTIAKALIAARSGDTIVVENGVYNEKIRVKPGIWLTARSRCKAIIDGNGKGVVVVLEGNAGISGFEIRNGTIGVQSNTSDNAILQCRISGMTETGISCSGRLPRIEDNIIVFNKGSGIQVWNTQSSPATAAAGTSVSINHNTIAYNANNGIGIGGNSLVSVENNIIAFNQRLAVKINDEAAAPLIIKNVFFQNGSMSYIKIEGNFSCDPRFVEPKKMRFSLQSDSPCLRYKDSNDEVPGVRGEF